MLFIACTVMGTAQITRSTNDDFETIASRDWAGGGIETYVETGGPQGDDDAFMQLDSRGGVGQGSHLACHNSNPRWTGNYAIAGVNAIGVWLKNFSTQTLNMRIVLFSTDTQRWTSKTGLTMNPNQGWTYHEFRLDPANMVRVLGNLTHKQVITNVTKIMIRHDPEPPSSGGAAIDSLLGIDDVQALRRPLNITP
ncbi:MAG: hypothetical protein HONBIEJF_00386 [Fimbriimonadaceae bacterium]|nr:hypothetical protein [Fimbriimonadaceae bacterium]